MALMKLNVALCVLVILYVLSALFGFLSSVPMILHVYPQSECLLFSYKLADKLYYGHYASCNIVAYCFLFVIAGAAYLTYKAVKEIRKRNGHALAGKFEDQQVPQKIVVPHVVALSLAALLTIITTAGYISACESIHKEVSSNVQTKLNADPYDTRGEEIRTIYEDDYKFHRYTNRYGNAFGSEFYTIRITCRAILTDPEVHQKLHDTHYELMSRYYGYWYGTDLYAYDSQYEATKTNALVEISMAGSWLSLICWLAGMILILMQKYVLHKHQKEAERMSMHSTMMGSQFNGKEGSLISGRASSFQRGGSRGSDRSVRSVRSVRRDVDDIALNSMLSAALTTTQQPVTSYGRKDIDDMVINQHIAQFRPNDPPAARYYSDHETEIF